jgi:polysaccharide export outer membrane protein
MHRRFAGSSPSSRQRIGRGLRVAAVAMSVALAGCATRYTAFEDLPYVPYRLSAGDKVRVLVFGQDNISNIYSVDASGRISMPLIGVVPVAGRTTAQLEGDVAARLRNGYVREPHVSVEVEQYRPFFVLGEVNQAGQFPFVNGLTAQSAVAIAGGFSPRAQKSGVEITRMIDGQPVCGFVPLTYALQPGDTVTVKERWF